MADTQTYRKKIFIFAAFALLLILAAVSIAAIVNSRAKSALHGDESVIRSTCGATLYPDLCISTVKKAALAASSPVKSPKDVMLTALKFTIQTVQENYVTVKKLAAGRKLTRREKTALGDCLEMIDDTLEELRESEAELKDYGFKNYNIAQHKENLMTLLSAAQTNQDSCLDGFSHDSADKRVRAALIAGQKHVFRLVSNVLAVLKTLSDTELAALSSSFAAANSSSPVERRLGELDWPTWLSAGDRRLLQATTVRPHVTVAADGTGNYRTVSAAVAAAPSGRTSSNRYVIRIKAGVYRENVEIPRGKTYLMFVGDGRLNTIITASLNVVDGSTTFRSATVAVVGTGFLARDITFQNNAGPSKHQAVALRVNADFSAFHRCSMLAYQDTLYVHSLRQFYTGCVIAGTVDFIFGNAEAVLQNCDIHARRPNQGQRNMVTAQARNDPNENTGIIIQRCRIGATSDLQGVIGRVETYLGRPWREYSRTVIMQTEISNVIHPAGWYEWDGDFAKATVYYAEHRNTGPGSNTANRVTWGGVKRQISAAEAQQFTAGRFVSGGSWLPATGFPHILGF